MVGTRPKADRTETLPERQLHAIARVLADPTRFDILKHIAAGNCMACAELRASTPITAATLSHHLKELESCGLIETSRRGKFVDITFQRAVWDAYLAKLREI
jgi:ArsR family transcriptional regulator